MMCHMCFLHRFWRLKAPVHIQSHQKEHWAQHFSFHGMRDLIEFLYCHCRCTASIVSANKISHATSTLNAINKIDKKINKKVVVKKSSKRIATKLKTLVGLIQRINGSWYKSIRRSAFTGKKCPIMSTMGTSWFCWVRCVPRSTYFVDPGTTFESNDLILTISLHLNLNLTMSNLSNQRKDRWMSLMY